MITVKWRDRFGNQLFQYCFGRILHLQTGREVRFPRFFSQDADHRQAYNELWIPRSQPGKSSSVLSKWLGPWKGVGAHVVTGHHFDPSLLENDRSLVLHGWFQNYAYYKPYKEQIRKSWLPLPSTDYLGVHPDDLYLHIRRTDFLQYRTSAQGAVAASDRSHLGDAISRMGSWRKIVIITDDPDDPYHDYFREKFGATVEHGTLTEDFLKLASARRLVISESTFAWWAAFLGNADRIICPSRPDSLWSAKRRPGLSHMDPAMDLVVDDETRFEFPILD